MPRRTNRKLSSNKLEPIEQFPNFTLKLLLPGDKIITMPMPEREATLRISLDVDPVFALQSGDLTLKLNGIVFAEHAP